MEVRGRRKGGGTEWVRGKREGGRRGCVRVGCHICTYL